MIRFNFKTCVVTSDALSEDVWTLIREKGARDVSFIVDQNVAEQEEIQKLRDFREPNVRVRQHAIVAVEPTTEMVNRYSDDFRQKPPDLLIGVGGGSILDLTKAISVMALHEGSVEDYHGTGKPFTRGIDKILVPTTAGTGSEVTSGAVLLNAKTDFKRSIGGRFVAADYAVLNPRVTLTMPDAVTAATGMDALAHAVESFTAKCANTFTRMYSLQAFSLVFNNLPKVFADRNSLQHRQSVLLGSCLAGIAISNSNTGACHSISYPLGIYCKVPHGLAVGTLLSEIVSINAERGCRLYAHLYDRIEGLPPLASTNAKTEAFVRALADYEALRHLGRSFRDYGIDEARIGFLAERGLDLQSALRNNPVDFGLQDAERALRNVIAIPANSKAGADAHHV
jgi:alcohol dehydrogenase